MNTTRLRRLCGFALFVAFASLAAPLAAQQGSVAGRVTDKVSSQPIQGAQVILSGTNLQAITNNEGHYRIDHVPPGQYQAQVRLIGYSMGQQPVTVAAGGAATLDIAMSAAAIPLEALVVSATGETQRVNPGDVVVLEGILVLALEPVRALLDVKVFVDSDADVRVLRRLSRDIKERGRDFDSVVEQYFRTVRPMHHGFVEPSKRYADIIIPHGGLNEIAIDMVAGAVRQKLG